MYCDLRCNSLNIAIIYHGYAYSDASNVLLHGLKTFKTLMFDAGLGNSVVSVFGAYTVGNTVAEPAADIDTQSVERSAWGAGDGCP